MNFLLENWYLVLAATVSGGLLLWPNLQKGGAAGGVSVSEAVQLVNREKAVVVDVRDTAQFDAGHVVGARHIPLEKLAAGVKGLPGNKTLPVVVVCERGVRAQQAVQKLRELGYDRAVALGGGMGAWRKEQMPIETSAA